MQRPAPLQSACCVPRGNHLSNVGGNGVIAHLPNHHNPCNGKPQANSAVAIAGLAAHRGLSARSRVKMANGGIKRIPKRVAVTAIFGKHCRQALICRPGLHIKLAALEFSKPTYRIRVFCCHGSPPTSKQKLKFFLQSTN